MFDPPLLIWEHNLECFWGGITGHTLVPHGTLERTGSYQLAEAKARGGDAIMLRIGYNFLPRDMFDQKSFISNPVQILVPPVNEYDSIKNYLWSDTLRIVMPYMPDQSK